MLKDTTLEQLQQIHTEFEDQYWDAPSDLDGRTRHTVLHLTRLISKIGSYSEQRDHGLPASTQQIEEEVIPDLLYWALALSTSFGVDLEEAFLARLEANKKKIDGFRSQRDAGS